MKSTCEMCGTTSEKCKNHYCSANPKYIPEIKKKHNAIDRTDKLIKDITELVR